MVLVFYFVHLFLDSNLSAFISLLINLTNENGNGLMLKNKKRLKICMFHSILHHLHPIKAESGWGNKKRKVQAQSEDLSLFLMPSQVKKPSNN